MMISIPTLKRAALSAIVGLPLIAAAVPGQAATWKVDPAHSKLGFSGTQTGEHFDGKFTRYDTNIAFDPEHLDAAHIGVTVETGSVTTANPQRDNALPGKDWLDVTEFPRAQFEAKSIRRAGNGAYEAVGALTIRGITRPLTVPLTFDISGDTARLKGHAQLIRTAFGVGQGPWASPQWVALEVGVDFDLLAKRAD
jgi:polyisoprenoid-binding protein YceI